VPGWGWAAMALPYFEEYNLVNLIDYGRNIEDPINDRARVATVQSFLCPSDNASGNPTFILNASTAPNIEFPLGQDHLPLRMASSNYVGSLGTNTLFDSTGTDDCPSHYIVGEGADKGNGPFYRNSKVNYKNVRDGLSHTVLVGERSSEQMDSTWVGVVHGAKDPIWRIVGHLREPPNGSGHMGHGHPWAMFSSEHSTLTNFLFMDGSVKPIFDEIEMDVFAAMGTVRGFEVIDDSQF